MKIYVYAIYFPTNCKYYIGITNNLKRRLSRDHFNSNSLIGKALNKYDDWTILILHTCRTRNQANKIESHALTRNQFSDQRPFKPKLKRDRY